MDPALPSGIDIGSTAIFYDTDVEITKLEVQRIRNMERYKRCIEWRGCSKANEWDIDKIGENEYERRGDKKIWG